MKILFLPKYESLGASSRYRTYQYLPYIKKCDIKYNISPLFSNKYLMYKYKKGKVNKLIVLRDILKRILTVFFKAPKYNLLIIEKELLPYFPPVLEYYLKKKKIKYIVDYDDAVWHNYDLHKNIILKYLLKNKIKYVMRNSSCVIAGSEYIKEYARKSKSKKIVKIPTVIDVENYTCNYNINGKQFIIGWIGSPFTSKQILLINEVLAKFTITHNTVVHLIGFDKKLQSKLLFNFKIIEWKESTEVDEICKFDVGIMPLINTPFERGKCGLKLIQYMGCRKPVVASPVGENSIIVDHYLNGFLAQNHQDWFYYLKLIYDSPGLAKKLGENGFRKVMEKYSTKVNKTIYISTVINVLNQK